MTKYNYYKVIQECTCLGWEDSDFHETDSTYCFKTEKDWSRFKENLKAYRENAGCPVRVIKRRELKNDTV